MSCCSLRQSQMLPLCPLWCPHVGIWPLLQFLTLKSCSCSSFPHPSFVLLSFEWSYIFLSDGPRLLTVPSWFSVRSSAYEDISLMHPWRETYSMSTDSSTILTVGLLLLLLFWMRKRPGYLRKNYLLEFNCFQCCLFLLYNEVNQCMYTCIPPSHSTSILPL